MDELILKCLQGEATALENEQVWQWLKSSHENFRHYEQLRDVWVASGMIHELSEIEINQRYEQIRKRMNLPNEKTVRKTYSINRFPEWLKIAAVFVFAFLLGAVLLNGYRQLPGGSTPTNEYVVEAPLGAKIKMSLADGTKVWLNAGSKISYSNDFNKNTRRVALVGEGYFEVAKNKHIPFYVEAGGITVKAIGTAFNVKAYQDEDFVETTLVEGKVAVSNGDKRVMLEPDQQVAFMRKDLTDSKFNEAELSKNINTDLYTSWRGKRWIFEGENMADFAKKLERRYDVKITIADQKLRDYKLSGSIEQQTLDQLLNALRLTVPLSYQINDEKVMLTIDERLKKEYELLMKK